MLDPSGAAVSGAEVTLTNIQTGDVRRQPSSTEGYFTFADLPRGEYSLKVVGSGFKELVLGPLTLTVGQQLTVRPTMQLGRVQESVMVTAEAPPVTTATGTVSQLIDTKRIEELPLNGRNVLQLVSLVPGVVSAGNAGQFGATQAVFSVSGGRGIDMNFSLDGGYNMNSFYNIANEYPNPDALQEFSTTTRSYSATFGRGSSSVAAVTKSGTNGWHGSAFHFLRNTVLDARPFFAGRRPDFKRNQYGGTFGGPIVRNKAFFFLGYQGTKVRGTPNDVRYRTLAPAEREGDFSNIATPLRDPLNPGQTFPGNRIPASRIQPFARTLLNRYMPLPNDGPEFYAFAPAGTRLDQNQVISRVDVNVTEKDRLMVRYMFNDVPQRNTAANIASSWLAELPTRFQNATLGYDRVFSPTVVNSLRISYVRNAFGLIATQDFSLRGLGLPIDESGSLPANGLTPSSSLSVSGFFTATNGVPTRDIMPTTHINDTLSWVRGRQSLTFGFELYRNRVNELQNWQTGGTISFTGSGSGSPAADLLLGRFDQFRQITGLTARLRQNLPSLFAQDDIRLTRRVTVNLGVRWEPYFGYESEDRQLLLYRPGQQSTVFPKAPSGLVYPGDEGVPDSIVGARWNNFAPRASVAWDVRGDGKTSVRAGFGSFYVPFSRGISLNRFTLIQPFTTDVTVFGGFTDNIWAAAPFNGRSPFPRPPAQDYNALREADFVPTANETSYGVPFKTQVDYQWSFSVQQALGGSTVMEVNYIGSSGSHQTLSVEGNSAIYIPGQSTVANTQQRRRDPRFGQVNVMKNAANSNYHGLQLVLNRRYAHGFSVLGSYTWSKALGLVASGGEGSNGPRNPDDYSLDYGPLDIDRRHNAVISTVWDVPGLPADTARWTRGLLNGWQLSGIGTITSGPPVTVRAGIDNSLRGIGNDTADQVGEWRFTGDRTKADRIQQWFNPAAFVPNAVGTFGTVGINSLRGPGRWNIDTAVAKTFRFREAQTLQLRGSFYNVFNHANLGNPNTTRSNPTFGRITSATDPRIAEVSLRFAF